MKCGFIIRLSGNKISFLYNRADKNGLFPFDGNRPVMPLAILKETDKVSIGEAALMAYQTRSEDAFIDVLEVTKRPGTFTLNGREHAYGELLLLAVEEHIRTFMQQAYLLQGKTYEDVKPGLPIGIIFNDCVSDTDQAHVMQMFTSHGYGNVEKIDFNTYLFSRFSTPHVLVVTGDGRDIALRLYDREAKRLLKQCAVPGAGADPRVEAVAELFFSLLTPAGATREKALPKLRLEAEVMLERNPAEYTGHINIDGMPFEFFARRSEVNAVSDAIEGSVRNLRIVEFLREAGTSLDECSVIVSPSLANNAYFSHALTADYPDAFLADDAMDKEVQKCIDREMREEDFDMHRFGATDRDMDVPTPADGITILGNKMSKKDIKGEPHSTSILFRISVPKDARYVEVYRRYSRTSKDNEQLIKRVPPTFEDTDEDGREKRIIKPTDFEDRGLMERRAYTYNFVAVYFNEYGHESHTRDLELDYCTVPDVVTVEPPVILVVANDDDDSATLKWALPKHTRLRLFVDDDPYTLGENSRIGNELDIMGTELPIDDTRQQYIIRKDFHGERHILPVTVRGGRMVAGKVVTIVSNPQPENVRASYVAAADAVQVAWKWNRLRSVQVVWQYKDDNPQILAVQRSGDEEEGRAEVALHPRKSDIDYEVRSFYTNSEKMPVIGKAVNKSVTDIPQAKVELQEVRNEGKGKYSYLLATVGEVPVPCDLRILVKEGSTDFGAPDKRLDVKREQWMNGKAVKQFDYERRKSSVDLNFRLVTADEAYAERLDFVSQEKTIEGTKATAPAPPSSHVLRYMALALLLAAGIFMAWKFMGGQSDKASPQEEPQEVATAEVAQKEPDTTEPPKEETTPEPRKEETTQEPSREVLFRLFKFSKAEERLKEGESAMIDLRTDPVAADEDVEWSNSNNSCIEISRNGKTSVSVRARKAGTAKITATTSKSRLVASIYISVEKKPKGTDNPPTVNTGEKKSGGTTKPTVTETTEVNTGEKTHNPTEPVVRPIGPTPPKKQENCKVEIRFSKPTELIAHVFIDGKEVGTSPWEGKYNTSINHTLSIMLEKPGKKKLKEVKGTWTIKAPNNNTIITLDPTPFE